MPPKITITKDKLLQGAFDIVKEEGLNALTARRLASKLNCSTRPLYNVYENIQKLQEEIIQVAIGYAFSNIINFKKTAHPFLNAGLGYLEFARNEKMLFQTLFLSGNTTFDFNHGQFPFDLNKQILHMKTDIALKDLNDSQLKEILLKIWVYAHGLATMISTDSIEVSDEKASCMLRDMFSILLSHEKKKGSG